MGNLVTFQNVDFHALSNHFPYLALPKHLGFLSGLDMPSQCLKYPYTIAI